MTAVSMEYIFSERVSFMSQGYSRHRTGNRVKYKYSFNTPTLKHIPLINHQRFSLLWRFPRYTRKNRSHINMVNSSINSPGSPAELPINKNSSPFLRILSNLLYYNGYDFKIKGMSRLFVLKILGTLGNWVMLLL